MNTKLKHTDGLAQRVFQALYAHFGPQHWWPGEGAFETVVGAILTQNTAWGNVEKAMVHLRAQKALSLSTLHELPLAQLEALIRPAGFYRVKARRLKAFTGHVVEHHNSSLDRLLSQSQDALRTELLSIHGIGPETADCIVLYAAGYPQFVVDAYTRRVLQRHDWLGAADSYGQAAEWFTEQLPVDVDLFNEYHALLVELGKVYCRSKPRCEACPLRSWLPDHNTGLSGSG